MGWGVDPLLSFKVCGQRADTINIALSAVLTFRDLFDILGGGWCPKNCCKMDSKSQPCLLNIKNQIHISHKSYSNRDKSQALPFKYLHIHFLKQMVGGIKSTSQFSQQRRLIHLINFICCCKIKLLIHY